MGRCHIIYNVTKSFSIDIQSRTEYDPCLLVSYPVRLCCVKAETSSNLPFFFGLHPHKSIIRTPDLYFLDSVFRNRFAAAFIWRLRIRNSVFFSFSCCFSCFFLAFLRLFSTALVSPATARIIAATHNNNCRTAVMRSCSLLIQFISASLSAVSD